MVEGLIQFSRIIYSAYIHTPMPSTSMMNVPSTMQMGSIGGMQIM